MDFTEEKTPAGITLNIIFKTWKFLAFKKGGESVYADDEGRSLLHKIPTLVFLGKTISLKKKYDKDYELFKVREDELIIPYYENNKKTFAYIPEKTSIDLIPVLTFEYESYPEMLKLHPADERIDHLLIDHTVSEVELAVISSRYKPGNTMNITPKKSKKSSRGFASPYTNVNILSQNTVFLAQTHLRKMALANLNQLLLDFEINQFDTQIIINLIDNVLKKISQESTGQEVPGSPRKMHIKKLKDLKTSFEFYLALIQKDGEKISEMVEEQEDDKHLAPFRTLLLKVKTDTEDESDLQKFSEFEEIVAEKSKKFTS